MTFSKNSQKKKIFQGKELNPQKSQNSQLGEGKRSFFENRLSSDSEVILIL